MNEIFFFFLLKWQNEMKHISHARCMCVISASCGGGGDNGGVVTFFLNTNAKAILCCMFCASQT